MKAIAHRGFADDYPENTIKAIANSSQVADIVEIDIRETADGVFVSNHNKFIRPETESSKYYISQNTYRDLHATLQESKQLPTLEEMLSHSHTTVLVELKGNLDVSQVVSTIQNASQQILLQSFHPQHIEKLSNSNWSGRYGLLVPTEEILDVHGIPPESITTVEEAVEFAERTDCSFLSMYHKLCTPETVQVCEERGVSTYVWTIRDPSLTESLAELGIDGIIADSQDYFPSKF